MHTDNDRITRIFGINNEVEYIIDNCMENGKFTKKPSYSTVKKFLNHEEICSFKGEPYYNDDTKLACTFFDPHYRCKKININEEEEVNIVRKVFRADLNEVHLFSDYVVREEELNFESEIEFEVDNLIREFNKTMIESNEKMLRYAKLHKLFLEDTDCEELFKLVYPNKICKIENGKMVVLDGSFTVKSDYITNCIGDNISEIVKYATRNAICGGDV